MGTAVEATAELITELWRIDKWKNFIIRNDQFHYRFRRGLQELFIKQEKEVLANLGQRKSMTRAIEDNLFDVPRWELIFEEFGQLLLPDVIQDRGEKEIMQLLIGVQFDVENPRVTRFLKEKVHKFSFETNSTTIDAIKKQMIEGVKAGEGIPELKTRVTTVFEHAKGYRAERIARTEVIGASNFGAHESYVQSGVVESKEWLATKDARVRPDHAAIDGERVKLDASFSNGLQHPGDPSGSAEQVIHCRCTILPIVAK